MILGFDIGNTNTRMVLYNNENVQPTVVFSYKTSHNPRENTIKKKIVTLIQSHENIHGSITISGAAYSSVVPSVNNIYDSIIHQTFNIKPHRISAQSNLSIAINYKDKNQLGIDRIVNAEAAHREHTGNKIIIDIGTATTLCVVLENGTFDGGLIAPGIGTTIKSLSQRTAKLPAFEFEAPESLIAHDTINALKSGFYYGWISMVEGLISKIEKHYNEIFSVIFTGGGAKSIYDYINGETIYDPLLLFKGIKYIYDLNQVE